MVAPSVAAPGYLRPSAAGTGLSAVAFAGRVALAG